MLKTAFLSAQTIGFWLPRLQAIAKVPEYGKHLCRMEKDKEGQDKGKLVSCVWQTWKRPGPSSFHAQTLKNTEKHSSTTILTALALFYENALMRLSGR
jgi:hypothetical protein